MRKLPKRFGSYSDGTKASVNVASDSFRLLLVLLLSQVESNSAINLIAFISLVSAFEYSGDGMMRLYIHKLIGNEELTLQQTYMATEAKNSILMYFGYINTKDCSSPSCSVLLVYVGCSHIVQAQDLLQEVNPK